MYAQLNRETFLRRLSKLCEEHGIKVERDDYAGPTSNPEFAFVGESIWIQMGEVQKAINNPQESL